MFTINIVNCTFRGGVDWIECTLHCTAFCDLLRRPADMVYGWVRLVTGALARHVASCTELCRVAHSCCHSSCVGWCLAYSLSERNIDVSGKRVGSSDPILLALFLGHTYAVPELSVRTQTRNSKTYQTVLKVFDQNFSITQFVLSQRQLFKLSIRSMASTLPTTLSKTLSDSF